MPPKRKTSNTSNTNSMNSDRTVVRPRTTRNAAMTPQDRTRDKLAREGLTQPILETKRVRRAPTSTYTPELSTPKPKQTRQPRNVEPKVDMDLLNRPIIKEANSHNHAHHEINRNGSYGVIANFVGIPNMLNLSSLKYIEFNNAHSPKVFNIEGYKKVGNFEQMWKFLHDFFAGTTYDKRMVASHHLVLFQKGSEKPPLLSGMKAVHDPETKIPNTAIHHHQQQYATPARLSNSVKTHLNVIKKADIAITKPLFEKYMRNTDINLLGDQEPVTLAKFFGQHGYKDDEDHLDISRLVYDYLYNPKFFDKFIVTHTSVGAGNIKAFLPQFAEFIKILERFRHSHDAFNAIANKMGTMTIAARRPSSTR